MLISFLFICSFLLNILTKNIHTALLRIMRGILRKKRKIIQGYMENDAKEPWQFIKTIHEDKGPIEWETKEISWDSLFLSSLIRLFYFNLVPLNSFILTHSFACDLFLFILFSFYFFNLFSLLYSRFSGIDNDPTTNWYI